MLRFLLGALLAVLAGGAFAQDASFGLTTGGTSQQAAARTPGVHTVFIHNPSTETETLWVDLGQAAAAVVANTSGESVGVAPGASLTVRTAQAVNVVASDTGHRVVVKIFP